MTVSRDSYRSRWVNADYGERRELLANLLDIGRYTCRGLAELLDADSHEVRAKLMSLRTQGRAQLVDGWWSAS